MIPTPEGKALLRYCRATLDLEGEALASIAGTGMQSTILLCMLGPTSIMCSRIISSLLPVLEEFPNLLLLLRFNISDTENRHHILRACKSPLREEIRRSTWLIRLVLSLTLSRKGLLNK